MNKNKFHNIVRLKSCDSFSVKVFYLFNIHFLHIKYLLFIRVSVSKTKFELTKKFGNTSFIHGDHLAYTFLLFKNIIGLFIGDWANLLSKSLLPLRIQYN